MIISSQRIALASMLFVATACSSSSNSPKDGGGSGGSGGASGTGGSGSGGASAGDAGDDATGTGGSDGGSATDTPVTMDGSGSDAVMTTKLITAASGGSVTVTGGTLKIPGGALAADTTITVTESAPGADTPNKDQINGLIYDFGPDGTTFSAPVELTLPLTGAVAAGKSAAVAFLDPRTKIWVPLNSNVVGAAGAQKVVALTTHFTPYAVLIVPTNGVCPMVAPCGGELLGTWDLVAFCSGKPTQSTSVDCMDGTTEYAQATYDLAGTWTVAADNTYMLTETIGITRLVREPAGCITLANMVRNPKIATCADLVPDLNKEFSVQTTTCTGTVTDACTCIAKTSGPSQETGTVTSSGTTFTTTKTGGQPSVNTYCVQGNVLTATTPDGSVYTAVKKQ